MSIAQNVAAVLAKVDAAARRAGRDPRDIRIVVASKYADADRLLEVAEAGLQVFGENRAQDLEAKHAVLGDRIEWHFIGHLQRNKVRKVVPLVDLIHSVDSLELAAEIDARAESAGKLQRILIEINVAGEESKHGVSPEESAGILSQINALPNVEIKGLMCMAPFAGPDEARRTFRALAQLSQEFSKKGFERHMDILSMGMSNDYEVAIEEGANLVRIGSAIFRNEEDAH